MRRTKREKITLSQIKKIRRNGDILINPKGETISKHDLEMLRKELLEWFDNAPIRYIPIYD